LDDELYYDSRLATGYGGNQVSVILKNMPAFAYYV
jgi:hypothetical protein